MKDVPFILSLFFTIPYGYSSVTVPLGKWNKSNLKVCFASPSQKKASRFFEESKSFPSRPNLQNGSELEKETIRDVISREYTPSKTGIHFYGFDDCDKSKADLYVYFGKAGERGPIAAAKLGQDLVSEYVEVLPDPDDGLDMYTSLIERKDNQGPGYVYFSTFKSYKNSVNGRVVVDEIQFLELSALHEFGHAAGLGHEDTRVESISNPFCGVANLNRDRFRNGQEVYTSEFDPYSIMSYCFINSIRDTLGLHFAVTRPGLPQNSYPRLPYPIMAYFGSNALISDPVLLISKKSNEMFTEVQIKIGLSGKDQLALRTLYKE